MESVDSNFIQQVVDDFNKLLAREDGWVFQHESKSIQVQTLANPSGNSIMRGVGNIKRSAAEIVAVIANPDLRGQWDLFYEEGAVLQASYKVGEDEVGHARMKFKGQWTVWPRDFSLLCVKRVLSDAKVLCLAKSIESDACPVDSGCVRGVMAPSGFLVESLSANECRVTYIIQVDLGGWLPYTVSNTVNTYLPLGLLGIRKLLTGTTDA